MTMPTGEELRELLELAAKAYGAEFFSPKRGKMSRWWYLDGVFKEWRPHEDDGDALRLAVKLGLSITPYPIYAEVKHSVLVKRLRIGDVLRNIKEPRIESIAVYDEDAMAATRLAILRCAAEVGRAMGES